MASKSNSPTNSTCPDPSPASTIDSTLDQTVHVPRNSPCPDPSPASTSDSTLDQTVHVPRNSPGRDPSPSDHWSGFYWLGQLNKPIPEHTMTFHSYIEAPIQEDSSLIQEDPASSDSLPDTYIFTPCSTPAEVHSSPEHPPQRRPDDFGLLEIHKYEMSTASEWGEEEDCQHSPPNRSDPDLLSREEVTPNQELVSLGPDSAASCPVECSESTSMKRKMESNHPQKEATKRLRNERDTESPPSQSSSTVDSTADGSSVTEDKEGNNSSMSSDED